MQHLRRLTATQRQADEIAAAGQDPAARSHALEQRVTALHLQVQRSEAQLRLAEAAAREQECRTKSAHAQGLAHAGALLAAARDARAAADEKCARLENELHARARAALGMQRRAVPPRRGTPRSRAAFRDFSVEVARAVGSEARACSRTLNSRGGGVQAPLDMQAPPAAPPAGEAVKRLEPREPPRHAGSGAPEQRTPAGDTARAPGGQAKHGGTGVRPPRLDLTTLRTATGSSRVQGGGSARLPSVARTAGARGVPGLGAIQSAR